MNIKQHTLRKKVETHEIIFEFHFAFGFQICASYIHMKFVGTEAIASVKICASLNGKCL